MKPVLFSLAIAAVLATAPASAQTSDPAPPASSGTPSNFLDYSGLPYTDMPRSEFERRFAPRECFNGRQLAGANRSGDKTLYVQSQRGGIFRLDLKTSCASLAAAETLTVRAYAQDVVCAGNAAVVTVKTAAGKAQCRVDNVSRLTSTEVAALATSARR